MHLAAITMLGAQGATARLLASAGALRAPTGLLRSQAANQATAPAADGASWAAFAPDVPRFAGAAADLLIEDTRTNLLTDPRTPGSTGWTNTAIASAVAAPGPDGTNSAFLITENTTTSFHGTFRGAVTTIAGTRYAGSVLVAPGTTDLVQIAFSNAGFGLTQFANFVLAGEGSVGFQGAGLVAAGIERIGAFYRCWIVGDAAAAVSSAGLTILFIQSATAGRAPSFAGTSRTLRLAWPQMEIGAAPTTPVLPPAGTPGAATRGADLVTAALADLAIGETGAGVYEATVVIPQPAPAGAAQSILEVEADADDRFIVRVAAGGTAVVLTRVTAGVAAGDVAAGSMTPGVPFRVRLTLPGDGTARLSLDEGAEVSVAGGPSLRLATLRIGNSAAGTTPMNGRLRRLLVQPGRDPLRLGLPQGLGWTPPFSVYRTAGGAYRHGFDPAPYVITGKAYYLSPAGNDANSGLSAASPRRSLWRILQDVTDYDVIYLAAGEYDAATGWGSRTMARSASIIATGGRAVLSRRATSVAWAAHTVPGVWLGTPAPAAAVGVVLDARYPGPTGLPGRLTRAATLAACETTPGTYFPTGNLVYLRLSDDRAPDADVNVQLGGLNAAVSNAVSGYLENLDFVGGNDCLLSSAAATGPDRNLVFNRCTFRFASAGDGLDLDASGNIFLLDCIAEMNELDGFNFNGPSGGGVGVRAAELGCIARWNGFTTSGFNNGSSFHADTAGVSVNCLVERNQNRNVHDVFGARRWALGCTSRDSRATDASACNWVSGQIPGQSGAGIACQLWLDGCLSAGSANDLVINAGATVRRRNSDTTGWTISNAGSFGTY
jgi:hypothetical protein